MRQHTCLYNLASIRLQAGQASRSATEESERARQWKIRYCVVVNWVHTCASAASPKLRARFCTPTRSTRIGAMSATVSSLCQYLSLFVLPKQVKRVPTEPAKKPNTKAMSTRTNSVGGSTAMPTTHAPDTTIDNCMISILEKVCAARPITSRPAVELSPSTATNRLYY